MKTEHLHGVKETLLFTLYFRALDYASKDPIVGDKWAADILRRISYRRWKVVMASGDRYLGLMRARKMDDWTTAFLAAHPRATVVHLGCGLDSRAFRLDVPPGVHWYDVDYPEVIELRERLYPERDGYTTVPTSVTAPGWLEQIPADDCRPVLVIAEGLLMYLREADVYPLLRRVTGRFSHGELIFDSISPWLAATARPLGYRLWGLKHPAVVQQRDVRLTLLEHMPTIWDVSRIPEPLFRALYRVPAFRDTLHLQRFRIGADHA
ncbi:class I SAM-dependent methyltransferase [Nonomuraea typhae]|uniref:Class I SAM-dependent methyltransferase n=1 Tax=Nonomuraea typhae TaxID=2603600 RepID=A0ABW7YZ68_9ACTN